MKTVSLISRLFLGTTLLVFGANGFLQFYPLPETTPEAKAFLDSLWNTGFVMHLEKSIEIIAGVLLLANRYVAVTALVLLPVTTIIMLTDVLLQPQYWYYGGTVFVLNVVLMVENAGRYRMVVGGR